MKLVVAILFVASVTAGRLDTYLPPSAGAAGGSAPFNLLPASRLGSTFGTRGAAAGISRPGALYGAPRYTGAVATPLGFTGVAAPVPILRLNNDNNGDGSYRFDYETANHIAAQESGRLNAADSSEVQGSYSYLAPNGQTISVQYVADEGGFRPAGDHLPTPPPIPAAILKSLQVNAAEEARGIVDDGQYRPTGGLVTRQHASPVNAQYLPPVAQGGYRY